VFIISYEAWTFQSESKSMFQHISDTLPDTS